MVAKAVEFLGGLAVGVILMLVISRRYDLSGTAPVVKLDRWVGTTWILEGTNGWKEVQ